MKGHTQEEEEEGQGEVKDSPLQECSFQECRSRQRARKKKRLTGAGMVKAENSFMVKEKLLEATAPAATSRSGLMATNTTPRC